MKVTASIAALAFAASVAAVPSWPEAAVTTTTTTTTTKATTTASGTWDDWAATTTTTTKKTTTTTVPVAAESTWADWEEPVSWTTTVVPAVTTYVPAPTKFIHGTDTYDCTAPTTLVLTKGPFTVSVPVFVKTTTSCSTAPVAEATTWADWTSSSVAPVAVSSYAPSGTGVKPATFTGAANSMVANVGAGLAAVGAVAAILL